MPSEPQSGEPLTREELLARLVQILRSGRESHTDAVNGLSYLLADEAAKEPEAGWAQTYEEVLAGLV